MSACRGRETRIYIYLTCPNGSRALTYGQGPTQDTCNLKSSVASATTSATSSTTASATASAKAKTWSFVSLSRHAEIKLLKYMSNIVLLYQRKINRRVEKTTVLLISLPPLARRDCYSTD